MFKRNYDKYVKMIKNTIVFLFLLFEINPIMLFFSLAISTINIITIICLFFKNELIFIKNGCQNNLT